ncbi:MAG: elongation factor P maturation arginine rhamnosyltransferase EarP [Aquabacterium sp.]
MRWDIFCRVIDNHGDLGVCWRLAADLALRGQAVRLWVDEPAALSWMAPEPRPAGIDLWPWTGDPEDPPAPADIVIEAFGCDPPAAFVAAMARCRPAPLWINLEYLSAEAYVERSHGLPSPQSNGPGAGLTKWFFYPGFTVRTGGLLQEPQLSGAGTRQDGDAWLAGQGWARRAGEQVALLFGYPDAPLPLLLAGLASQPTLLLAAPGALRDHLHALPHPTRLRIVDLPWLSQTAFDQLLRATDLNLVRGEDSFVRAQWAGRPMLWQIYPQHDGAHGPKLEAWLDLMTRRWPPGAQASHRAWQRAWNALSAPPGHPPMPVDLWAAAAQWHGHAAAWSRQLAEPTDLVTRLLAFCAQRLQGDGSAHL